MTICASHSSSFISISKESTSLEVVEAAYRHKNDADSTSNASSWRQLGRIASVDKEEMICLQASKSESTDRSESTAASTSANAGLGDKMDGGMGGEDLTAAVVAFFLGLILIGLVALSERPLLVQEARRRNKKTSTTGSTLLKKKTYYPRFKALVLIGAAFSNPNNVIGTAAPKGSPYSSVSDGDSESEESTHVSSVCNCCC